MWNVDGELIQVEVGSNVVKAFTQSDRRGLFGKIMGQNPPPEGQLLVEYTKKFREQLSKENIYLPTIHFTDSSDIGINNFKVYVGIEYYIGDITKENLFDVISYLIGRYQIEDTSCDSIKRILDEGVEKILAKNFQDAVLDFAKVYYWSSLVNGCEQELVKATLNIGGINLINNRIDGAEEAAKRACVIVSKDYFQNPYLRYFSYNFSANILAMQNKISEAAKYYNIAYQNIKMTRDIYYCTNVLFSMASMKLLLKSYKEAAEILDAIVESIKDDDSFGKGILIELYEFRSFVSNLTVASLENKYLELQERYLKISKSFLTKAYDTILTVAVKVGPFAVSSFIGALVGGDKINNYQSGDKNTIIIKK
jgi:tetratricopeptide (TPR) repeat protein